MLLQFACRSGRKQKQGVNKGGAAGAAETAGQGGKNRKAPPEGMGEA